MLELRNIHKTYHTGDTDTVVLKGISVKFRRNEFTSILGPSGCGKTTLLNIIGGLDQYDEGDLLIEGISTKNYNDREWDTYRNYRVGFIFQSYNLIMHQSVVANVEMALTLSGVSRGERRKRAVEALERVGLGDQIDKKPNQLSGGQMQRVAIARALVNNPEIILADEPTGALDSKTSIQIMDLLKEIASDKLVIMVTHNPDIARDYSTRIIELKDGQIVGDSSPYTEEETFGQERPTRRTSMSFLTTLGLSFRNLLTKKGRTILTAFAGSIGIIGIALVLSLSNGVKQMAKQLERDSLTEYPIRVERNSFDFASLFSGLASSASSSGESACEAGKLCSTDDLVRPSVLAGESIITQNNIREFKRYVESTEDFGKYADEIDFTYDMQLQVYDDSYARVSPSTLKTDDSGNLFRELFTTDEKMNSMFDLITGKYPENMNEAVLVVGSNGMIPDSLLYSIGVKDEQQLPGEFLAITTNPDYRVETVTYSPEDFLNRSFKVILNTDYYVNQDGTYIDMSANQTYMKEKVDNGIPLTIVGVIQSKTADDSYIGVRHDLTMYILQEIAKSELYQEQTANREVNLLTGVPFDAVSNTYESVIAKLALYDLDEPSSISFYPKDFSSKEKLIELIDAYNAQMKENGKEANIVKYTDMMGAMIGSFTSVVEIVSIVLIAFIAISLIVSSIMIAIITYISVLERTKEIGILRAIGASKRDVVRVFRAETIIEGLIAGVMGIVITVLINTGVNAVLGALNMPEVAQLPLTGAAILIVLSVLLNVWAGRVPSKMAAKKNPVEALRSE